MPITTKRLILLGSRLDSSMCFVRVEHCDMSVHIRVGYVYIPLQFGVYGTLRQSAKVFDSLCL
jgi:hypothetical protein